MASARTLSWEILKKVIIDNKFSNVLLNEVSNSDFDLKTKNLIFNLVHGTLKQKIYLEYLTNHKLIDPQKTKKELQILIWMSLYQMRFLQGIPNYAIVNEAVEIAKTSFPKQKNFVNACLQKTIRMGDDFYKITHKNEELAFCLTHAFPYQLFKKIKSDFNLEIAKKFVIDSLNKPLISFRINTLKILPSDFLTAYQDIFKIHPHQIEGCYIAKMAIVKSEVYANGLITIQDPASILVGNTLNPTKDSKILDMCSAPGGKLTHLAAIMENSGTIDACELSSNKIAKIEENIKRLNVSNVNLKCMDATKVEHENFYDFILLDAPCSGLGVLKRKEDIKIKNNNFDFKDLVEIQEKLLATAYKALKVGGTLVYSTCTINKSENNLQIAKFLQNHPDLSLISEQQLFGFEMNTDGFYIAKIVKK